ncbi:MAG: hypothetical protein IIB83_06510, partial [Bacteroidetes bacterium]|nr:hypothetical protein [Bacteroidota bacterium]
MRGTERLALYKIFSFFFLISAFSITVSAQSFLPAETDSLITNGINSIILQNYDDAENYFNELDTMDKIDPLGKIYLTVTSISKSFDLGEEYKWDYISNLLEEAKEIAKENYNKKPKSVLRLYTLALAEGYYAYIKGLESNWLSAISNGYDAIKNFEGCVMMDSTFYEAYTAIGTFKY